MQRSKIKTDTVVYAVSHFSSLPRRAVVLDTEAWQRTTSAQGHRLRPDPNGKGWSTDKRGMLAVLTWLPEITDAELFDAAARVAVELRNQDVLPSLKVEVPGKKARVGIALLRPQQVKMPWAEHEAHQQRRRDADVIARQRVARQRAEEALARGEVHGLLAELGEASQHLAAAQGDVEPRMTWRQLAGIILAARHLGREDTRDLITAQAREVTDTGRRFPLGNIAEAHGVELGEGD